MLQNHYKIVTPLNEKHGKIRVISEKYEKEYKTSLNNVIHKVNQLQKQRLYKLDDKKSARLTELYDCKRKTFLGFN